MGRESRYGVSFGIYLRRKLPKSCSSRLLRCRKILDGLGAQANELHVQMITGRQTSCHKAVHHNQSGLNTSDNSDNRGKEVNHLASRIRHVDCSSIFDCFASVAKARRPDERQGEGRAVLLAVEVVFNCLHHGQTVDLVIMSTSRNIVAEARRSSEMDFNSNVCIPNRLGCSEENVELARLNVRDE